MYLRRIIGIVTAGFLLAVLHVFGGAESLLIPAAHAAPLTASSPVIQTMQVFVSVVITIMNFFMWLLFMALDIVMNPTFIFDIRDGGQDGPLLLMLQNIWQFSRDLVNVALSFALIYGTFKMIVTADSSGMKTALPKIAAALVVVNFSWFLPRVVFDVSQVATYTIFQLPRLLNAADCQVPGSNGQPPRACQVAIDYRFLEQTDAVLNTNGWNCDLYPLVCIRYVDFNDPAAGNNSMLHSKIINGLVVNHARMSALVDMAAPPGSGVGPGGGVQEQLFATITTTVKLMVILMFHVALLFPLAAMVAAFFLRIPVLWVTMAFMPFVALGYAGDFEKLFGKMDPKSAIMGEFLKAAFLPARVAVPFTIGYIMVNAGAATPAPAGLDRFNIVLPILSQVDSVWHIIWMAIAMFIIWKFSFDALGEGPEVAKGVVEKVRGAGQQALQLAAKYPLAQPILPFTSMSPLQLSKVLSPRRLLNEINVNGTAPSLKDLLNGRPGGPGGNNNAPAINQVINNTRGDPAVAQAINNLTRNIDNTNLTEAIRALRNTAEGQRQLAGHSDQEIARALKDDLQRSRSLDEAGLKRLDAHIRNLSATAPNPPPPGGGPP